MKTILQSKMFWLSSLAAGLLMCMSGHSHAEIPPAKQEISKEKQLELLANLVQDAEDVYTRNRDDAHAALWYGVSLASYATAKGGFSGMIHNRAARIHLEKSLALNECAENGLAYSVLADLYKDKDKLKSQEYLRKTESCKTGS